MLIQKTENNRKKHAEMTELNITSLISSGIKISIKYIPGVRKILQRDSMDLGIQILISFGALIFLHGCSLSIKF